MRTVLVITIFVALLFSQRCDIYSPDSVDSNCIVTNMKNIMSNNGISLRVFYHKLFKRQFKCHVIAYIYCIELVTTAYGITRS